MTSPQKQFVETLQSMADAKKTLVGLDQKSLMATAEKLFASKDLEKKGTAKVNVGGVPERVLELLKKLA